jgi:hypothetical protein
VGRWKRRPSRYLVKSRRITDGELLHLLTGKPSKGVSEFDRSVYSSLRAVKSATVKSLLWTIAFGALGVLAHFNVVKAATALGLEVAPTVFSPVALIGLSIASASLCFSWTKQTYLQAWFSWKFKCGNPGLRAEYLLIFPEAFWHFSYLPGNIGNPPFLMARRSLWIQLAYLLLILIVLVVGTLGSLALWYILAEDVWTTSALSHSVSVLTVVFSGAISLLGWLSPFYYDLPRRYTHMGLVNLLGKLEGESNAKAHRRLIRVADRMGLVKWPKNKPTSTTG